MRIATITLQKHRPLSFDKILIEDIEGNNYEVLDTEIEEVLEKNGQLEKEKEE